MSRLDRYRQLQTKFLELLMRPFIRFCLRRNLRFQTFVAVAKKVFIDVATTELEVRGERVNVSRLSVYTGLCRPDVRAILQGEAPVRIEKAVGLMGRIMAQWEQNPKFRNKKGEPRVLSYQGEGNEFQELVATENRDINSGTVLFELLRSGLAVKTKTGVKLLTKIAQAGKVDDPVRKYELLSRDIDTLMTAVEENIEDPDWISNAHLRTQFDNIYIADLPKARLWLLEELKLLHRKARDFLAGCDRDINPRFDPSGHEEPAGGYVVLGTIGFTSRLPPEAESNHPLAIKRQAAGK